MSKDSTERIERRAGEWLARRDSDSWSETQQAELDQWLDESLEHRVAWLRLLDTWESSLRLRALGAGHSADEVPPPGQWNLSPFFPREAQLDGRAEGGEARVRPARLALAASLVLALLIGAAAYWWPRNIYETPVGGMASVPIADGSKVILNTDSKIALVVTNTERRIELKRGEAFFEVARDPNRPFVVEAGARRIVAIGTAFSVRREPELQVIVTEGAVRVESSSAPLRTANEVASSPQIEVEQGARVLKAGSVARAHRDRLVVQDRKVPEVEEQIAWRSGNVVFRDVSVPQAVAEFNRYNERKIVIEDPAAADYTIGGSFRTNNVDAFVRLLEQAYPLRADFQQHVIRLTAR